MCCESLCCACNVARFVLVHRPQGPFAVALRRTWLGIASGRSRFGEAGTACCLVHELRHSGGGRRARVSWRVRHAKVQSSLNPQTEKKKIRQKVRIHTLFTVSGLSMAVAR